MDIVKELVLRKTSVSLSAVSILALYVCYYLLSTYWKLRDIPGPFLAKFTDFQRMFWVKTMRGHEIHSEIHDKYGEVVRVGPNTVSLADPADIPALYPMRSGLPKSKFYRGIMPYTKGGALPAVFTTQDEDLHKTLKNPVASLYSLTNVIKFEPFIDEEIGILFEHLDKRFVKTQTAFDLADWIQYFAYEVMGTMTFSRRYGFLEQGKDVNGLLRAVWDFMLAVGPMTQFPWLDRILYKSFVADILKNHVAVPILKIVAQHVEDRKKQDFDDYEKDARIPHGDFLSHFLQIQDSNKTIPDWSCKVWTFSNVIAGSDSTTAVMRALIYNLLANPNSLQKLRQELLDANKKSGLNHPYPKWNEVKDLPYLDACVNEAVRLHPPFILPLERVAPQGGVVIGGRYFPEGTCIGMNPYVVNRHRPTYGEDADSWRPERFLVEDLALRKRRENGIMTFGAGKRVCLGKWVAYMEIKKITPALILNYDFELLDPKSYFVESSYFFRQEGINVKIRRREF